MKSVQVVATTFDGTLAAIDIAVAVARAESANLEVVVPHFAPVDVAPGLWAQRAVQKYRTRLDDLGSEGDVEFCRCDTIKDLVARLHPSDTTVVVGGPTGRWLMSPEERFADRLSREGRRVVVAVTAPCPSRRRLPLTAAAAVSVLLWATGAAFAQPPAPPPPWQYGGFLDVGRLFSSTSPSNDLFRNRGTTPRVNTWDLNMTAAYVKKAPSEASRVGVEATVQEGKDSEIFGFSATAPNIDGAEWLLHLGPTNMSYLAPVGKGLTLQGGIFASLIGYDGLYAKDNVTYTRPWTGDYTPYFMLGVNASYPATPKLTVTGILVNGYWHLAHANNEPSFGGQLAYKATDEITVKETVLIGPHQSDTAFRYWRFFSDTIVERRVQRVTAAVEFQVGTEGVATAGDPQALWMAAQAPVKWSIRGPWSLTARPEFAWDRDGRWIGAEQSVRAFTSTVEYRRPLGQAQAIVKLEYRVDNSKGSGGGFFDSPDVSPGVPRLVPTQHLFGVGLIFTFEGTYSR